MIDKEISNIDLSATQNHFFHLYKNEGKIFDYKERMKNDINEIRSKRRQNNFDIHRALMISEEDDKIINNCFYRKTNKSKNKWANLMMLAEWFIVVPESFYEDYFMKFCPFGKHVLLVSQKNSTALYNKNGAMLASFKSSLPGGGLSEQSGQHAVFDCIWDRAENTVYLLDIVYYLRRDFRDMPARDRFNWLDNYLGDAGATGGTGLVSSNATEFKVLESVPCHRDRLETVFATSPPMPLDGLLFYAGDAGYVNGSTYSVSWLKPYMVPEVLLGLAGELHPAFMAAMPPEYASFRDDIARFNAAHGWTDRPNSGGDLAAPVAMDTK